MVTLHEVITFLVSMQISISSLQTHNVNRCGRSRHLARKLSLRRKRSSPNVFEMAATESRVSFPLSAADLPPSPTKSSNLSETAEVPACNVPSRSPLPALAIAPETKLGTASSGLGTLEP